MSVLTLARGMAFGCARDEGEALGMGRGSGEKGKNMVEVLGVKSTAREQGPLARWIKEKMPLELAVAGCGNRRVSTLEGLSVGPYVNLYIEARERRYRLELSADQAEELAAQLKEHARVSRA